MNINNYFWTEEDMSGGMPLPGGQPGAQPPADPNIANQGQNSEQPPDLTTDPQYPEMPEKHDDMDFEQWKKEFHKQSIKGDVNVLIDLINKVRDRELDAHQKKFVEDNLQIQFIRQNANVQKAGQDIRKNLKQQLDRNNPSVSIVNELATVLQEMPELNLIFIKIAGTQGLKAELHRKYIGGLLGAVQVGAGGNAADLIFNEKEYCVKVSTRFNATFGIVSLGGWSLRTSDPEDYLSQSELKMLEEGSPDERNVLRQRVVMESIAEQFRERSLLLTVVLTDGTICTVGFDIGTSLKAAYSSGKLVIRLKQIEGRPAMIGSDGKIVPFMDVKIYYTKETGEMDEDGMPAKEELEFINWESGNLFLVASMDTLKDAASGIGSGIVFKSVPYAGNPSDLKTLGRCFPSTSEMIFRNC